jgi:hypothetical protein
MATAKRGEAAMARRAHAATLSALACIAGVLLILGGCRKAAVEPSVPKVDTRTSAGEPSYIIKPAESATPPREHWYKDYQVVLEHKPETDAEAEKLAAEKKTDIARAVAPLLEEIRASVEMQRKASDKWSLLALTIQRGKKPSDINLIAEIGLTSLYARRPVIAFNNMPLDLCIAKLCRESGIQDAQQRNFNPRVFWTKNNVSAMEALDAVLNSNGFERKLTDTYYRSNFRVQDYDTREELLKAVVDAVIERGATMNAARPAVVVTPKEKAPKPAEEAPKKPAPQPDVKPD